MHTYTHRVSSSKKVSESLSQWMSSISISGTLEHIPIARNVAIIIRIIQTRKCWFWISVYVKEISFPGKSFQRRTMKFPSAYELSLRCFSKLLYTPTGPLRVQSPPVFQRPAHKLIPPINQCSLLYQDSLFFPRGQVASTFCFLGVDLIVWIYGHFHSGLQVT